ncbi:Uroporphyrinogen-III C-methyltransferase [compost metagenome]
MLTGTKKNGAIADDLKLAMQSNTTVIIYMGMKNLPLIVDTYIKNGKGDNPAALIQHASLPHSKTAIGTVKDLEKLALLNNITHPALIVIGEVTQLNTYSKLQEALF